MVERIINAVVLVVVSLIVRYFGIRMADWIRRRDKLRRRQAHLALKQKRAETAIHRLEVHCGFDDLTDFRVEDEY